MCAHESDEKLLWNAEGGVPYKNVTNQGQYPRTHNVRPYNKNKHGGTPKEPFMTNITYPKKPRSADERKQIKVNVQGKALCADS